MGDIGPKIGFHAVDNGFLAFDHVRVPRTNMLMKVSSDETPRSINPPPFFIFVYFMGTQNLEVTPSGQFLPPKAEKAAYGTMVLIRAQLVNGASMALSKATTIAVRYAHARTDFIGGCFCSHVEGFRI